MRNAVTNRADRVNNRYVLYTSNYGAGWTTWNTSLSLAQRVFLLEYQPFVDHLLAGGTLTENHPLVLQFSADFAAAFPESQDVYVCTLGLKNLTVQTLPAGTLVRVTEYDGAETVVTQTDSYQWL